MPRKTRKKTKPKTKKPTTIKTQDPKERKLNR